MPIDIERFERESEFQRSDTYAERIIRFLATNADKAFQRDEIADGTSIDSDTVSAVLSRLKDRNLARHKPPYWAIGDPDRVRASLDFARDIEAFDEQLGEEEMESWREAGSDQQHPSERDTDES